MDPDGSPHSPDGVTAMLDQTPKYQRSLRSLNQLTTRFVTCLQESEDGVLDLKDVSDLTPVNHTIQQTLIPTLEMFYHICTINKIALLGLFLNVMCNVTVVD